MIETEIISREEGFKTDPYLCSEGYVTIGYGKKIGPNVQDVSRWLGISLSNEQLLSLYTFSIPEHIAVEWMECDIDHLLARMNSIPVLRECMDRGNENRRAVLISMAYQMGVHGLLKFKKMLSAILHENWREAAKEGLDSRWAKQTPSRANRHMEVMRTGELSEYYL
jgi:lysozyme